MFSAPLSKPSSIYPTAYGRGRGSEMTALKITLLQVFNRYLQAGGEEKSVARIQRHAALRHDVPRCFFESSSWAGPEAPNPLTQTARFFYNADSARQFEQRARETSAQAALFHNIYPVGSPSLYSSALRQGLPVIQYLHNYRPFSVGGSLFYDGRVQTAPLHQNYLGEIRAGAWQGRLKSALCALMLKHLHRSGWLESVKAWVCISQFMADLLAKHGCVPRDRLHVLRHSWDAMPHLPEIEDDGSYLFLGRLIPEKGLIPLVQAWHELRQQLGPRTPTLNIAGDGVLQSFIEASTAENASIHYLGHLSGEAKHDALRRCRALIAPSIWWEPLGLMIYEAYDYAKPVLAARSGGLIETIQHGQTGLLHAPGDVVGIAQDVLGLESMPHDQRRQLGDNARQWLLRETSVRIWQDKFDQMLQNLS
jgi:glycosyltransferase involved in cell wall biosynthesis